MFSTKQSAFIRLIFLIFSFIYITPALSFDGAQNMSLILKSPDFVHLGEIPKAFTCDGEDNSPALNWAGVPINTKSLVLIVDDPDARRIAHGNAVSAPPGFDPEDPKAPVRLLGRDGRLLAVARAREGLLRPEVVLA